MHVLNFLEQDNALNKRMRKTRKARISPERRENMRMQLLLVEGHLQIHHDCNIHNLDKIQRGCSNALDQKIYILVSSLTIFLKVRR